MARNMHVRDGAGGRTGMGNGWTWDDDGSAPFRYRRWAWEMGGGTKINVSAWRACVLWSR